MIQKQIRQFIYNGETNSNVNWKGNILANCNGNISHLGIQAPPGIYFNINDSESDIAIGGTGIYELDLGIGVISSLVFINLEDVDTIYNGEKIIVDVVYEQEG